MTLDIYGIGNALVDIESKSSFELLQSLNIEKGIMTLVDNETLQTYKKEHAPYIQEKACGGSAANTIITAAHLGANCAYSCKVTNDTDGQFYLNDLEKNNVRCTNRTTEHSLPTGNCLVMVTDDADRTMTTFLGSSQEFGPEDLDESQLKSSQIVYIEGYLVSSETGKQAAINAHNLANKHGVKTAFTCSDPAMVEFFRSGILEIIGDHVDYLFCNEAEAFSLSETTIVDEALAYLKNKATTVIITQGKRGALISNSEETIKLNGIHVDAIDTNGAGDCFAGSFLAAITQGKSIKEAGQLAIQLSAKLVTQFGPRLNLDDVKNIVTTA